MSGGAWASVPWSRGTGSAGGPALHHPSSVLLQELLDD